MELDILQKMIKIVPLSFKNRIAFNYIFTTALLVIIVFFFIHYIVKYSVYEKVNNDVLSEVKKHLLEIEIKENCILLIHEDEWKEREHNTFDIDPVFVQFVDESGYLLEKSPNLKKISLDFFSKMDNNTLFNNRLSDNTIIRQTQVPIYQNKKIVGYLIVAMSLENASMVLNNLTRVMIITFPLILFFLFLIARFIAGRSIKPINSIIETSNNITKDNLKSRIPLPENRDELYVLSQTINDLLDRIESAIEREKQFTSDASHELRTPLAVIKGTLEVLIRKPREQSEYEEKINFCVSEVNRLNYLVDQLLLLARFENQGTEIKKEKISLNALVLETISRYNKEIVEKELQIITAFEKEYFVETDAYLCSIIINNLVSNAIKYSELKSIFSIKITKLGSQISCSFIDSGIGISTEDMEKIFIPFYRSNSDEHPDIKGTGLGLSIVKRLCILLKIDICVYGKPQKGATFVLTF